MNITEISNRKKRHFHIRKTISGTAKRPRLSVFVSNLEVYVQIIDDKTGHTLAIASSLLSEVTGKTGIEKARNLGEFIAKRAQEKGVTKVVFDRGGYAYHGRVQAIAEGARSGGLEF